jgi:hypothetical protein
MIYYYVTNSENYLKSTFEKFPEEYPELKNEYESFQFNTHFKPTTVVPEGNFVFLFDLRHRLVAKTQNLEQFKLPQEIEPAVKEGRCKILLWGWMENWSSHEFWMIVNKIKQKHHYLSHKDFIFVTASLEDFSKAPFWSFYANKMEWQWHQCSYKHVERLQEDERFQPEKHFICLNRRPTWFRFLTVTKLIDHFAFGEITHLAPESHLDDHFYGTQTAEDKYNTEFNIFKEKELSQLNPRPDKIYPETRDTLNGVENLVEQSTDPNKHKNWWKNQNPKQWYWHKVSTDETFYFHTKAEAVKFRKRELEPFYPKKREFGPLADKWRKKVEPMLPLRIKDDRHDVNAGANPNKDTDAAKYVRAYLHVCTETKIERGKDEVIQGTNLFASEKIFKPMFYKRPFVAIAQRGLLTKLKELGYQYFPNMLNDAYDKKGDNWNRIIDATEQVSRWVKMSTDQKKILFNEAKPIYEHNFSLLMKRGKELEKNMHDNIMRCFSNVR